MLVDLAEFNLPVYDEPKHPRLKEYQHEHTGEWSASVTAADAFAFVAPEYNHMPTPALVNALDFSCCTNGPTSPPALSAMAGCRPACARGQILKLQLCGLNMMPMPMGVPIPMVSQYIGDSGVFVPNDPIVTGAGVMLDELHRWAEALKPMRAKAA